MYDLEKLKIVAKELDMEIIDIQGVSGVYNEDRELLASFDEIHEIYAKMFENESE